MNVDEDEVEPFLEGDADSRKVDWSPWTPVFDVDDTELSSASKKGSVRREELLTSESMLASLSSRSELALARLSDTLSVSS